MFRQNQYFILLLIIIIVKLIQNTHCEIKLSVEQGVLIGKEEKTYKGDVYYSFKGIPYAKPPLGHLRFLAPLPPENWQGIFNATEHKSKCAQENGGNFIGSNDCLYLNVYTAELPNENMGKLKPVMFFIHGGVFVRGSGDSSQFGPDFLITEDVIVVTINYRLGVFGFLRVDNPDVKIPGNAGIRDMLMALKWVKKNIENFGGNPENVTIFGESAGGMAVHILSISPLGKGLFQQAIIESASALADWAMIAPGINPLNELAKSLNIQEEDETKIVQNLIKLTSKELIETQNKIRNQFGYRRPFALTIEKQPDQSSTVIPDDPKALLKNSQVPTIFGYNSREGMLVASQFNSRINDFKDLIPLNLDAPKGSKKAEKIAKLIGKHYYDGEKPSMETFDVTSHLLTDVNFVYPITKALQETLKFSKKKLFLYRFSVDDSRERYTKYSYNITLPGACHGDELPFLFYIENTLTRLIADGIEDLTVKRIVAFWTNFAKYGDPNPFGKSDLISIEWKPVENDTFHYLELGENLSTGFNPDWKGFQFWDKIYEENY